MGSFLRTIPLIGALLLSATPVDAIETTEKITEACYETVEPTLLCQAGPIIGDGETRVKMLCELMKQDLITPENAVEMWMNYRGPVLWNETATRTLKEYPNCPLKPKSAAYSFD